MHGLNIIALGELLQQFRMWSGEPVDQLVSITDRKQAHARREAQAHDHAMQGAAKILVFIYDQGRVLRIKRTLQPRVTPQRPHSKQRHVIEVDATHPPQCHFVGFHKLS